MEFRGNGQHHRSYLKEYLFFFYIHELDVIQHHPCMDMERHSLLAKSALLKNFTDMQN